MTVSDGPIRSRNGRVLLFASLAINLFLLGLIAGGWATGLRVLPPSMNQGGLQGPFLGDFDVPRIMQALPSKSRREFRSIMRQAGPDFRDAMERSIDARRQVNAALKAEPFDSKKLSASLVDTREADEHVRKVMHDIFYEFAVNLDDADRKLFVDAIEEVSREHRPRRGRFPGRWRQDRPPDAP